MFYVKIKNEEKDRSENKIRYTFHNKCYICEDDASKDGVREHRIPKAAGKTNKLLEKSSNYFWACGRCNGIKLNKYYDVLSKCQYENVHCGIIDCTKCDPNEYINITISLDCKNEIKIDEKKYAPCINNTVSLLRAVYCPEGRVDTTKLGVLKERIVEQVGELYIILNKLAIDYRVTPQKPKREINKRKKEIIDYASPEKPFFAFKFSCIEEMCNANHDNGLGEVLEDILKKLSAHPAVNNCCDRKDSCVGFLTTLQSSEISNT